jgi:hypothetical protein
MHNPGTSRRGIAKTRHCERSEAIQLSFFLRKESWIASSQGLLAMTIVGFAQLLNCHRPA